VKSGDLVVLTTAPKTPACQRLTAPTQLLNRNGASIWWDVSDDPGHKLFARQKPNFRVGGEPARFGMTRPTSFIDWRVTGCTYVGGDLALHALIRSGADAGRYYRVRACLRGPDFAAGRRALRRILASVRFAKSYGKSRVIVQPPAGSRS
jgi:hypothetical protein